MCFLRVVVTKKKKKRSAKSIHILFIVKSLGQYVLNCFMSDFVRKYVGCFFQSSIHDSLIMVYCSGYMSPEYIRHGQFSAKSDVFSFGVLVLEIISGKKNSNFYQSDGAADLLSYVSYFPYILIATPCVSILLVFYP